MRDRRLPDLSWYNDVDANAVAWLGNLIKAGELSGVVDSRSIEALAPRDVAGPGHRHFFARIGGWGLAAQLAAWPEELDLWIGLCLC